MTHAQAVAGSCGLPLITTDSVGCRETVMDGVNGYLIAPRNSDALFYAMKKIIELDVEHLRSMALASREYIVNNFNESLVLQKYQKVLMEQ
ncbi:glycosyltransferase [Vibrio navarrensis]|uniref:glycosyltransferase n=1 Tax=Vibrio navarrensis TaxID=29495 RepID=UPI001DD3BF00|nr:glycosyltransferase [Vibrio navarrensis]MBE4602008.1 hypothetical protein [Vibrio navarrensis]